MKRDLVKVEYGTKYSDGSGWERRLSVDTHVAEAKLEIHGNLITMSLEELQWLVETILEARITLGWTHDQTKDKA